MVRFVLTNAIGSTMTMNIPYLLRLLNVEKDQSMKRCNVLIQMIEDSYKLVIEISVEFQLMMFVLFVKQKNMTLLNRDSTLQSLSQLLADLKLIVNQDVLTFHAVHVTLPSLPIIISLSITNVSMTVQTSTESQILIIMDNVYVLLAAKKFLEIVFSLPCIV